MKRRMVCLLLTLALIAASVPIVFAEGETLTIDQLRLKYPDGKYWNHAGQPGTDLALNNQDGVTDTPCPRHGNLGTDSQTCNAFVPNDKPMSWQCMGFAEKLGFDATGFNPRANENGWVTYFDKSALDRVKPGDIVRYRGHSIYVIGVTEDTLTYADCNSDGHCRICWDRTVSRALVAENFVHLRSAPSEAKNEERDCSCTAELAGTYVCTTSATGLNIRSGHGTQYGRIGSIPKGETVTVLLSDGKWAHVEYNGILGYVSMEFLAKVDDTGCDCTTQRAGEYICTTGGSMLRIREKHSVDSQCLGYIPNGASVLVIQENGKWAHVEYDGITGFASMDYLVPAEKPKDECKCTSEYAGEYICTTLTSPLRIRAGHSTDSERVGYIQPGETVKVTAGDGEWAHVEVNGVTGYASLAYLERVQTDPGCSCVETFAGEYVCTTVTSPLRIRADHSTDSERIGYIPAGAVVHVTMADGEWAHVEYNGVSGYASMTYLEKK